MKTSSSPTLSNATTSAPAAFAHLSNQMSGNGDARARELTLALGRAVGA